MNIVRILVLSLSLLSTFSPAEAGLWERIKSVFVAPKEAEPPKIKVLINHDEEAIMLEVKGKYKIIDPYTNSEIASRHIGKSRLIQPMTAGLKWGEEFPGVYQLLFVPVDPNTTFVVDGIEYRGSIYVYDIGGSISVVNEADIEDYVSSLLSPKIDKPYSQEALAAIAIVERTKAYHQTNVAENPYWHVDADQVGYEGYAVTLQSNGVEDAINSTRYMVLSKTGPYEGTLTPFDAKWLPKGAPQGVLSLEQAENLARQGQHAAKILAGTFPSTTIQLSFGEKAAREIAER